MTDEANKTSAIKVRESWRIDDTDKVFKVNNDGSIFINDEIGSLHLPADYRDFMIQHPGGVTPTEEDNFIVAQFRAEAVEVQLEYLYELADLISDYSSNYESTYAYASKSRLPAKHAIIASGLIDDFVLNVDRESIDFGKIYNWTRAGDPWGEGDNTEGLGFVADSFTDLMNNLSEETDID